MMDIIVTVIIVTVIIKTVIIVTVVIVTYFRKNNMTHLQQIRCWKGSILRFSRCLTPADVDKGGR